MDCYGDHILSCRACSYSCMSDSTPWHDRIVDVVARMAQTTNMHVSHSDRRTRAASLAYSPNWRPDLTFLHAARDGNHMIVDVTCPSVVTQTAVPATSHMPLAAAIAVATEKHDSSIVSKVMSPPSPTPHHATLRC